MATIFKASELVKTVPSIAPYIDESDYIHVALGFEPLTKETTILSFIWDTREVVKASVAYDDNEAIEAITSIDKDIIAKTAAKDNGKWLKATSETVFAWHRIHWINVGYFGMPKSLKLQRSVSDLTGDVVYSTASKAILTANKETNTCIWNRDNIESIVGYLPDEFWYDQFESINMFIPTAKQVRDILRNIFSGQSEALSQA